MRGLDARQRGFSLLEAVVAMVLVASLGMALFSWINTNLISLQRTHEANLQAEATHNILEYMHTVNPMLTPQGKIDLGSYTLAWDALPRAPAKDGSGYPAGISLWQLALYETKVTVTRAEGSAWFDLQLTQVGYKRVRSMWLTP